MSQTRWLFVLGPIFLLNGKEEHPPQGTVNYLKLLTATLPLFTQAAVSPKSIQNTKGIAESVVLNSNKSLL